MSRVAHPCMEEKQAWRLLSAELRRSHLSSEQAPFAQGSKLLLIASLNCPSSQSFRGKRCSKMPAGRVGFGYSLIELPELKKRQRGQGQMQVAVLGMAHGSHEVVLKGSH